MNIHPHKNEQYQEVLIKKPHTATHNSTWNHPDRIATWTPGSAIPTTLNSIAMFAEPYRSTNQLSDALDTPFETEKQFKAAGLVILESDNRVWVIHPTNGFAGYKATFPKGRHDSGESLRTTAVRETFEETGLICMPGMTLGDYDRTTSRCRMFIGSRIGGSPAEMGWESQAVSLIPVSALHTVVHTAVDLQIVKDLLQILSK